MDKTNDPKFDPRLRHFLAEMETAEPDDQKPDVEVFIEVANPQAMETVKNTKGVRCFVNIVDGYCTATIPYAILKGCLAELSTQLGVVEIEAARFLRPKLKESVHRINGWRGINQENQMSEGSGAVIGIVDYGLDFTLNDFRHHDTGKTRVAFLWDQMLDAKADGEKSPPKYGYGVEYCAARIDEALTAMENGKNPFEIVRHNPRQPSSDDIIFKDVDGHGTHVAGIAAGNGTTVDEEYKNGFIGVAPGSTLVFVNLGRRDTLSQVGSSNGTLANSVKLAHAIAYCFEIAEKLHKPCVVNLSMGFNGGGHDGNMAVEWIIDALLQKSGRAVVVSAGNEDEKSIHAGGYLPLGRPVAVTWSVGKQLGAILHPDPSDNELEIWYSRDSSVEARLVAPWDEDSSPIIAPGQRRRYDFVGGEAVIITSDLATPWEGDARIHIELSGGTREHGIRFGKWSIELRATKSSPNEKKADCVRYDAWIERTDPNDAPAYMRSKFDSFETSDAITPTPPITLTTPSTANSAISVGSCHNGVPAGGPIPAATLPRMGAADTTAGRGIKRDNISTFSGRGRTRDNRKKPEIVAPGETVFSSNPNAGCKENGVTRPARIGMNGTSMAAPHVTGVVARLLSRQPYLNFKDILDLLVKSARQPDGGDDWDCKWGYGMVDAEAAVKLLEKKLGRQ